MSKFVLMNKAFRFARQKLLLPWIASTYVRNSWSVVSRWFDPPTGKLKALNSFVRPVSSAFQLSPFRFQKGPKLFHGLRHLDRKSVV